MKPGKILHRFTANDGQTVILRTPRWGDLDDLLEFINSLIDEGVDIVRTQPVSRIEEAEWLGRKLADVETGSKLCVVAEIDNTVIATTELRMNKGQQSHVGVLAIGIRKEYRDKGIGTEMLNTLIAYARKIGLKLLTLIVNSSNERAQHVYAKVGFRECGRIPKKIFKNGQYIDEVTMVRMLEDW